MRESAEVAEDVDLNRSQNCPCFQVQTRTIDCKDERVQHLEEIVTESDCTTSLDLLEEIMVRMSQTEQES